MKPRLREWLFLIGLLLGLGIVGIACGGEEEREKTATNIYSKYGFSFEYPEESTVTEKGLIENEADENSGIVTIQFGGDEARMFSVSWMLLAPPELARPGYKMEDRLEGAFESMEGSQVFASLDRGELVETHRDGNRMLYQYFTATGDDGQQGHGILAGFYCLESRKLFSFSTFNTAVSTKQDILRDFETYLDSFVCE